MSCKNKSKRSYDKSFLKLGFTELNKRQAEMCYMYKKNFQKNRRRRINYSVI